jgi:hypothetical protein
MINFIINLTVSPFGRNGVAGVTNCRLGGPVFELQWRGEIFITLPDSCTTGIVSISRGQRGRNSVLPPPRGPRWSMGRSIPHAAQPLPIPLSIPHTAQPLPIQLSIPHTAQPLLIPLSIPHTAQSLLIPLSISHTAQPLPIPLSLLSRFSNWSSE